MYVYVSKNSFYQPWLVAKNQKPTGDTDRRPVAPRR